MALDVPMMRLVQGDVGSGKTLVAALAALRAIAHGKQVALMAPTELLAEQHANNFRNWFAPLGIEVGWLAGKQKGKARLAQQEAIASGQVQMIVGTHAIFQEQVQFNGLALVIIDEQHRFGVHQRLALWEKGQQQGFHPHQLIMTATPIPRTLAMTAYADLDTSVIDELPPGRTPVTTVAIPDTRRTDIIDRVRHACITEGRQAPTGAQARVVAEIERDMALDVPMMRLVQGDVGSGKTLVAALAALRAIAHGKQVALMAPTELLAEQHANNFRNWFAPLGIEVGWLAGKQKGKARLAQQEAIASGQVQRIVGTHAIFQAQVQFNGLALVLIDEQHRFGVHQRLALWEKGQQQGFHPHQLIMTATPIPRTLPVTAFAIPDTRRTDIIDRVRHACITEGRQAYWVCTLIEESELLEAQAAEATWEELKLALPELNVGLVHGRMKPVEKQAVMASFKQGELHLLVATTVIEVGVDVPNASLMIIENPERLGLAQLHQLRGRVGRGAVASHCVLLYKTPLSKTAQIRLQVLRDSNDGFVIAQKDLEIRGPGELLGTRQTGNAEFKVADLLRDQAMIPEVQRLARHIHERYPQQAKALIERWMPETERYSVRRVMLSLKWRIYCAIRR